MSPPDGASGRLFVQAEPHLMRMLARAEAPKPRLLWARFPGRPAESAHAGHRGFEVVPGEGDDHVPVVVAGMHADAPRAGVGPPVAPTHVDGGPAEIDSKNARAAAPSGAPALAGTGRADEAVGGRENGPEDMLRPARPSGSNQSDGGAVSDGEIAVESMGARLVANATYGQSAVVRSAEVGGAVGALGQSVLAIGRGVEARARAAMLGGTMAQEGRKGATYDDIVALPAHVVGEIVFGVLHTHPRPAPRHAQAVSTLGEELGPPFKRGRGGPGGWLILFEPELHLGPHVLVPDLGGWRRERMPELPVDEAYFSVAPDWVCEVLSPSTAALDRGDKLTVYRTQGVAHVWLIDPVAQTLEIFELADSRYTLRDVFTAGARCRAVPFEAIELDLALLWLR